MFSSVNGEDRVLQWEDPELYCDLDYNPPISTICVCISSEPLWIGN